MRAAFANELLKAGQDPRVILLSGDIGNRMFDPFKEKYPDRFLNCGVAEANMIGISAGMALRGLKPVVYTIAAFATIRCLEQIRVDLCIQNQPVVIVGTGGGLSYAELNPTHHSCEDIAVMRTMPGMTVVCPGDAVEVRLALNAALDHDGPVYLRLGKKGEPVVHRKSPPFSIGKGIPVRDGKDICILSTGNMLPLAVKTADRLHPGLSTHVVSFHTVKPLDDHLLLSVFQRFRLVITLEEHSITGGLGGAVAEWLSDCQSAKAQLLRIGTPDSFLLTPGRQGDVRQVLGLTPELIASRILSNVESV